MPLSNFAEQIPILTTQVWVPADGTGYKPIVPAQPTIWRLDTLLALNDDAVNHVFSLQLVDPSAAVHLLGQVTIPAHAGEQGNPVFDVFNALFPPTQVGFTFTVGWFLQGALVVAATSAVGVVSQGGYF